MSKWNYSIKVREMDIEIRAVKGARIEKRCVPKGKASIEVLEAILSKYETDEFYVTNVLEYIKTFNPSNIEIEPA